MALTRKMLKGMGLTEEQVETIIDAHTETVEGIKSDLEKAEKRAEEADKLLERAEKAEKEFGDYKEEQAKKETRAAKEKAFRAILKDANLNEKGIEKAVKYAAWESMELDEKGGLKDAKEHIKSAKEDWSEYVETVTKTGADTSTPPENNGGEKLTKADIYKKDDKGRYVMSASERQKALAANPNLMN